MTLGERSLEREVLALFDRQADMLLRRMRQAAPAVVAAARAHAEGLGARHRRLAGRARGRSGRARQARPSSRPRSTALGAAIDEAKAAIARLLRAH